MRAPVINKALLAGAGRSHACVVHIVASYSLVIERNCLINVLASLKALTTLLSQQAMLKCLIISDK